jgi:hypothetical protein
MLTRQQKRTRKKVYKIIKGQGPRRPELRNLIHQGVVDASIDSYTIYFIFSSNNKDEVYSEVSKVIEPDGVEPVLRPYDCTGQMFCRPAKFIQLVDRIAVVQRVSFDV